MQDLVKRINELAAKQKNNSLTTEEKKEQQKLRSQYIEAMKLSLESHLKTIKVVNEKGEDITPIKLKELKNK